MPGAETCVVVGAGLAGATTAHALREEGFAGRIVLIGDEGEPPYERPPLSKDYLMGVTDRDATFVHPAGWYAEHTIELRLGVAVTRVDKRRHEVALADGGRIGYSKLVLATGSSPRRLTLNGAGHDGVHYLRRLPDSDRLRATFRTARRIAIVGGGWIGLETAAAARAAGIDVTVLEVAALPLQRVLGDRIAGIFADLHRRHGVDLRCGVQISEITGEDGRVTGVRLSDHSYIPADAVVVGAGITPNTALAEAAGIVVDNGVRVDAHLRTSDDDIYAVGDVANADHPLLGRHLRVEHWANALYQPPVAARAMLGQDVVYDRLPYFFTDQFELSMEYTGYAEPGEYDEVLVRASRSDGGADGAADGGSEFIAFWLSGGRVLAGMNVNVWDVADTIGAIIRSGRAVDPRRLADPAVPLESLG